MRTPAYAIYRDRDQVYFGAFVGWSDDPMFGVRSDAMEFAKFAHAAALMRSRAELRCFADCRVVPIWREVRA